MGELRVEVLIDEGEEKGLLGLVEKERGPRVFRWFFAEESGSLPGGSIAVRETERGREGELEKGGEGVRRREEKGEEEEASTAEPTRPNRKCSWSEKRKGLRIGRRVLGSSAE